MNSVCREELVVMRVPLFNGYIYRRLDKGERIKSIQGENLVYIGLKASHRHTKLHLQYHQ